MDTLQFIDHLKGVLPSIFPTWSLSPAGASKEDLDRVEHETGLALPQRLREFLSICDGIGDDIYLRENLHLLSAAKIVEWWQIHVDVIEWLPDELPDDGDVISHCDPEIQPFVVNRKWLPMAEEMDGNWSVYVDYDPAPGGQVGQVIWVYPEATEWRLIGHSLGQFWDWIAEDLNRRLKALGTAP